jgi:cytoskeletal protein RodZ
MQQDIREILKKHKEENIELSANHANKFQTLLTKKLHSKKTRKKNYKWISIAASVVLLVGLGIKFYSTESIEIKQNETKEISLGSISPEFQTIENYYKNSIRLEISQLKRTDKNKEVIAGYLLKIVELTKEYKSLTLDLNKNGVNDATIDALIRNLQLRVQLLKRMKKQLKQLKNLNITQNEKQII